MQEHSYKLRSGVAGFVSLPSGGTMEVTITAGSVVNVLPAPADGTELVNVRYGDLSCRLPLRELQKCGSLVESAAA
jgi:hypothetical protein